MLHRIVPSLALVALAACASPPVQHRAGVLDYLYPADTQPVPPTDVHLILPLRVGVAFAPDVPGGRRSTSNYWAGELGNYELVFDASAKQRLLQRVVDAFQGTEGVQSIQTIPASYLKPEGGFENVDRSCTIMSATARRGLGTAKLAVSNAAAGGTGGGDRALVHEVPEEEAPGAEALIAALPSGTHVAVAAHAAGGALVVLARVHREPAGEP